MVSTKISGWYLSLSRQSLLILVIFSIMLSIFTISTQLSPYNSYNSSNIHLRAPGFHQLRSIEADQRREGTTPAATLRPDDGLLMSVHSSSSTPMLFDRQRTLWAAGWNARYTQYFAGVPPLITWTQEAETIFEREYRQLHFPSDCASVNG